MAEGGGGGIWLPILVVPGRPVGGPEPDNLKMIVAI